MMIFMYICDFSYVGLVTLKNHIKCAMPYLWNRVLGVQRVEPKEVGYVAIPRDSPRYGYSSVLQDVTEQDIFATTQDLQG